MLCPLSPRDPRIATAQFVQVVLIDFSAIANNILQYKQQALKRTCQIDHRLNQHLTHRPFLTSQIVLSISNHTHGSTTWAVLLFNAYQIICQRTEHWLIAKGTMKRSWGINNIEFSSSLQSVHPLEPTSTGSYVNYGGLHITISVRSSKGGKQIWQKQQGNTRSAAIYRFPKNSHER